LAPRCPGDHLRATVHCPHACPAHDCGRHVAHRAGIPSYSIPTRPRFASGRSPDARLWPWQLMRPDWRPDAAIPRQRERFSCRLRIPVSDELPSGSSARYTYYHLRHPLSRARSPTGSVTGSHDAIEGLITFGKGGSLCLGNSPGEGSRVVSRKAKSVVSSTLRVQESDGKWRT
jgi:hypothetical protein